MIRRIVIILSILWGATMFVVAQAPVIEWQKTIGGSEGDGRPAVVPIPSEGNYFLSGRTFSKDGDFSFMHPEHQVYLMKMDAKGNILWKKSLGRKDAYEWGGSGIITSDNKLLITCWTKNYSSTLSSDYDPWILKLDLDGNIEWEKIYGGERTDRLGVPYEMDNGDFIFIGSSQSSSGDVPDNNGLRDGWIIRTDKDGDLLWSRTYGTEKSESFGRMVPTKDGYLINGSVNHSPIDQITFPSGELDITLTKLDKDFNLIWSNYYGGSNTEISGSFTKIGEDKFLVSALSYSIQGESGDLRDRGGVWIFEVNSVGQILWSNILGGSSKDHIKKIILDEDGNLIAIGESRSDDGDVGGNYGKRDIWLARLGEQGKVIWKQNYGGSEDETVGKILAVGKGKYLMFTGTNSSDHDVSSNQGEQDIWIASLEIPNVFASKESCQFNPFISSEGITLSFDKLFLESVEVVVYDVLGRIVYQAEEQMIEQSEILVALPNPLATGQYYISVGCSSGWSTRAFMYLR